MNDSTTYFITGVNGDSKARMSTRDKETAIELYDELVKTHFGVQLNAQRTRVTEWRIR